MDSVSTSCHCPTHRCITLSRTLGSSKAKQLIAYIEAGDVRGTKRLLKAGARMNGGEEEVECPPLVAAALAGQPTIAKVLLKAGADVDVAAPRDICAPTPCRHLILGGGRCALHAAVGHLHAQVVRLLLDAGANVNAVDRGGVTPLIALCQTFPGDDDPDDSKRVAIARQLLQQGAEASVLDGTGYSSVHYAVQWENMELLDVILWGVPVAVNHRSEDGFTPLYLAAMLGRAGTVTHLLSRGARQPAAYHLECTNGCQHALECPLKAAVICDHEGVVRVFLDGGVEAIAGLGGVLETALRYTMPRWRTTILSMLLAAEGREGEQRWANCTFRGISLLHTAASYNALPNISVLLRAGADETAVCPTGETPHGAVGQNVKEDTRATGDPAEEAAVHRMLARGPAYRAHSYSWPTATDAGGVADDGGGFADTSSYSSRCEARDIPLRVRIWRPRRREFLVRLVSRYILRGTTAAENQLIVVDDPGGDATGNC